MNLINQNINSYEQNPKYYPGFKADAAAPFIYPMQQQAVPEVQDVELPELYYMPEHYKKPKTFKDIIKKVDLLGLIHPWFEHPLLMIGTCAGLSLGVDAFDKSCNKEYSKSIVGKAAELGDSIEGSKVVQSEAGQGVIKGIKNGWHKIRDFAMKSDVINSMVKTPSEPEWSTPKEELKHTNYRIVTKFKMLANEFGLVPGNGLTEENVPHKVIGVKNLALDKPEIEYLKKLYNVDNISKIPGEEVVNRIMLRRLGKPEEEIAEIIKQSNATSIVRSELFKKSGLTPAELEAIFKDETGETLELVRKASGNLRGTKIVHGRFVLPGPRQPFANIEGFQGIYNRAHSLTLNEGAKTRTGKFLSKLLQKIYRGFTFGNQKQAVLIWVTPFLARSIINTAKADKEEKVGTAVSEFINSFSWVFIFPIVLRAIYAYGGIQYAGMGVEKVNEYKKKIHDFNARTNPGSPDSFKTLAEYKKAKHDLKIELKKLREVKNQNLLTETLRGISKFSKADLLKIESYKGGTAGANLLRKLPNTIKDYLIYAPGRFIMFLLVGFPLVSKLVDKCTAKLFGRSYDEFKDSDVEERSKKQEEFAINDLRARLVEIQRQKLNSPAVTEPNTSEATKNSESTPPLVPVSMLKLAEEAQKNEPKSTIAEPLTEEAETVKAAETPLVESIDEASAIEADRKAKEILSAKASETASETEEEMINVTELPDKKEVIETKPAEQSTKEVLPSGQSIGNENIAEESASERITETEALQSEIAAETRNYDDYTYIPSSKNVIKDGTEEGPQPDRYIPSSENKIAAAQNSEQPINKYIPSQLGINVNKVFDNSELEKAIRRSQRAERKALDILAGNFGNI